MESNDVGRTTGQAAAIEADIERQIGGKIDDLASGVLKRPDVKGKPLSEISFEVTNESLLTELVNKNFVSKDVFMTRRIGLTALVAALLMNHPESKSFFSDKEALPHTRSVIERIVASHFQEPSEES